MTTQTLDRAIGLLHLLASGGTGGLRLVDLQQHSGLTRPTVHRILDTLKGHGFVEQLPETRRYRLGGELAVIGWSAARDVHDLRDLCEEEMVALANRSGDTSFLTIRSGNQAVCIDRQSGSYPVKAFTVDVGTRRPLGVGAGGIALLAALDDERVERFFLDADNHLGAYPNVSVRALRKSVVEARAKGYAFSEGLVLKGVRGLAVTVSNKESRAIAAVSLAAIDDRMPPRRIPELVRMLNAHARRIEHRLNAADSRGAAPARRVVKAL
ncbi:IclR family transcriptional regulator [Hydrogenophaga sp.]|jgi:DNA-binding IclR family transcriptional regulator|uniref:IclR family transcriptional regulator n=1 Tax=Hydrogenophaga sp. TaxID=1904254 RepID=UPI003F70A752